MLFILISWLLLILIGCKYCKAPVPQPLTKDTTLVLKGICAIEIMLGHLGLSTGSIFLFANRKAGILFVGMFFALSGYGLMHNLCNKREYLNGFFQQRIFKIALPAYIIFIFDVFLLQKPFFNIISIEKIFSGINWYVWEMIAMYIIFYICAKFLKPKQLCATLFILSTVFIIIAFLLKIDNPWYGSTLCFPLGMYYYLNESALVENFVTTSKYKWIVIISTLLLCVGIILFFILGEESLLGNLIGRNVASVAFVILIIFLLYHFHIGNAFSKWLGKYSYEIFLFHFVYLKFFKETENDILFSILVMTATIISSVIFAKCNSIIKAILSKNKTRSYL